MRYRRTPHHYFENKCRTKAEESRVNYTYDLHLVLPNIPLIANRISFTLTLQHKKVTQAVSNSFQTLILHLTRIFGKNYFE